MSKSNAEYWVDKVAGNRTRDAETDQLLAAAGWTIVRAWEHNDPADVVDRVVAALSSRSCES